MDPFQSAEGKLERARSHLDEVEHGLRSWIAAAKTIEQETNGQTVLTRVFWDPELHLPDAAVGDCVHNFRCVLDHIAHALAIRNGAASDDRSVAWPICSSVQHWTGTGKRPTISGKWKVRLLSPSDQQWIESWQPFRHVSGATLIELEYLDNRDKHRSLNLSYAQPLAEFHPDPPLPRGVMAEIHRRPILNGSVIHKATYPTGYDGPLAGIPALFGICVNRSTGGFIEIRSYLRDELLPLVSEILEEARNR